jgi:hypothetical protein
MHGDAVWLKPAFAEIFRAFGCRVSCRFGEKCNDLDGLLSLNVVPSKRSLVGLRKCSLAGLAAESLNPQASIGSESLSCSVLASQAGHAASPLVFWAEKPENDVLGFKCGSTPRLNLFPRTRLAPSTGVLLTTHVVAICSFQSPFCSLPASV